MSIKEVVKLQKEYQKLVDSKRLSKKAMCEDWQRTYLRKRNHVQ